MHRFLADWYRVSRIDPIGDDLVKRSTSIETIVGAVDTNKAVDLARLFLRSKSVSAEFKEQFALDFQSDDPTFRMRDNELELCLLAGAVIAQYVETKRTDVGDSMALALISGACPALRPSVLLPDVVTIAKNYLFQEAQRVRAYRHSPEIKGLSLEWEQLLTKVKETAANKDLSATVEALGTPLLAGVGAVTKSAKEAIEHLDTLVATLSEQTNVLWWLFAGTSSELVRPYSDIPPPVACLIAGKELADLTEVMPGPIAATAVLDKILSNCSDKTENVSFVDAIDAVDPEWKQKCLVPAESRLDELSPIHMAFRKSANGAAWIKSFESASGIKLKKASLSPVELANQMYNERLLQKAVRE